MVKNIILASASPRRKEILERVVKDFTIMPSSAPEPVYSQDETPGKFAGKVAISKLLGISAEKYSESLIIAYDTIVALGYNVFGKPADFDEAKSMLKTLSGKTHSVFTGYAFYYNGKIISGAEETKVTFKELTDEQIVNYINTYRPYDKAGAYGIQEINDEFVEKLEGDYDNVVGLPLKKSIEIWKKYIN